MLLADFKNKLRVLQKNLQGTNLKDTRRALTDLQRDVFDADLDYAARDELKKDIQQLFDQLKILQEKEQEVFEREADENHAHLKEKLYSCIAFVENNLNDHETAWEKLIELQDDFRGRRMRSDERETLYTALQALFQIVKKRRHEAHEAFQAASENAFSQLMDTVNDLVNSAETADLKLLWEKLLDTARAIRETKMEAARKKVLFDALDDGFAIAKIRKEEQQCALRQETADNARLIEQKLQHAAAEIEQNADFHQNWQLLIAIQKDFSAHKLEKKHREDLYTELQLLFEALKSRLSKEQESFEAAANEALQHLRPLVEKATRLAKTSREFKKTKGFLIRVQRDFKGRRMRKDDRESLYSKLQSAFDTLNRRINEHIASKKDIREFKVDSKLTDLYTQVDELETEINKDIQDLHLLENKLEDMQVLDANRSTADLANQKHQIRLMQAAITRKSTQLRDLQDEIQQLLAQKDWLDSIE